MVSSTQKQQSIQKPLRILMVTGVYPTAQHPHAGTFIKSQVDSLRQAGLEVDVIHPRATFMPLRYAIALLHIFTKSLSGKYDVIHGHYGLWCLTCRFQWSLPVVASYLGDDILGTIKADGSYSFKGRVVAMISRKLSYLVNAVIVKSAQMKQVIAGPQQKIFIIPNGVNFQQFQPVPREEARRALGWSQGKYYVLFSNDPQIPVKNFPLAHAAVQTVKTRGWDVELVVANGLPHDTIVQYMNASNALILSSHAEGSPNVVKEAMACNVPIVATNVGDVATIIGHTAGCTVCTPDDVAEMAHGIEIALAYSQRTNGREDIRHLDSSAIAQRIIKVYTQVTGRQPQCSGQTQAGIKDVVYVEK